LVRAHYQATLVELSAAAPELLLLGGDDFVQQHLAQARQSLRLGERGLARQRRATGAVAPIATIAALATLAALHPRTSPLWIVVAALLALSTFEALATLRGALDTAVAISAAAERLEDLEAALPGGDQPWPGARTLRADHLVLREGDALLLKDGSLRLRAGHHLAVTGPSGSGKSTLLRTLGALDTVRGGRVSIEETELTDLGEDELRRHLAYVPSEPGLTRGFARDVVHMGRSGTRDFLIDLAALGLFVDPNGKWDELSRGERARVAIVRAMVTSPDIYLLDEPTGALGGEETSAVLALLAETGASVVVVTHDSMVMDWCDEVLELRDGELRFLSR
jgi:putative ABC transport system ATP-binding protein